MPGDESLSRSLPVRVVEASTKSLSGKCTEKVGGNGVRRTAAPENVWVRSHSRIVDLRLASLLAAGPGKMMIACGAL
jgi:hypothetical protein